MFAFGALAAMLAMSSSLSVRQYLVSGETRPEQIVTNDNRRPAGSMAGRTVEIHLEIRRGVWHPTRDDEGGPAVSVNAFAEEGKPLSVPGPLIRVPAGAIVHAVVRNTLFNSVVVYGLSARGAGTPRAEDTVQIRPGAVQEVSFPAGAPGTYYYWAKSARDTSSADPLARAPVDAQLGGALIVDQRGTVGSERDRVFVFNLWDPSPLSAAGSAVPDVESAFWFTINGKASPYTERLSYSVGDTIRMRFENMSVSAHPMSLTGTFYNGENRGDGLPGDSTVAIWHPIAKNAINLPPDSTAARPAAQRMENGATYDFALTPATPGDFSFVVRSANGTMLARFPVHIR
jgi:FtsP/CotA-like multicopper oxidase with cupredoxin domain